MRRVKKTLKNGLSAPVARYQATMAIRKRRTMGLGRRNRRSRGGGAAPKRTRETGQMDSSTIAAPIKSDSRYETTLVEARCRRVSQPGRRLAANPPKTPMEMPAADMKLNPAGRFFWLVNPAIAGAKGTGQTAEMMPDIAASISSAGLLMNEARNAESTAVRANEAINVARMPKRCMASTASNDPAMDPAVITLEMRPMVSSRNPSFSR